MPTGLVKSMIHAFGARPLDDLVGDVEHDRHGAHRLRETARAGGLLTDAAARQRCRLVVQPRGLATDAQLQQHRVGVLDRLFQRVGDRQGTGPVLSGQDASGQPADDLAALGVGVHQDQLGQRAGGRTVPSDPDTSSGV